MPYLRVKNELPLIPGYSEGAIAYAPDAADAPLNECICYINPVQAGSGEPSPTNVREILGFDSGVITRCGKNLIDLPNQSGSGYIYNREPIFLKSGTYILSVDISAIGGQTLALRKDNTELFKLDFSSTIGRNSIPFTISDDANNISLYSGASGTFTNFQIEIGSTATAYEEYTGSTTTTDFGTTVYGGTLDVVSGVLTTTHRYIDMGSLSWTSNSTYANVFNGSFSPSAKNTTSFISDTYAVYSSSTVMNYDYGIAIGTLLNAFYVKNKDYSDPTAFKNAMTGKYICYELANPTTTQLTPQEVKSLLGSNNFYHDCNGDTKITYIRRLDS